MKTFKLLLALLLTIIISSSSLISQVNLASPSNWLYPNGNSEATKYQSIKSSSQNIDSFKVKWSTSAIAGDVEPLIGNIINNPKIFPTFKYAPNEIVAVMAGRIIVVDAKGNTRKVTNHFNQYIKGVSCLFDTNSTGLNSPSTTPMVMGLDMIEFENNIDSLAYSYIAGFDNLADTVKMLKRLAIDLRLYKPNTFASIKPVYGKRIGDDIMVYATVNMSQPQIPDTFAFLPPFLRGMATFNLGKYVGSYPMPDAGDDIDSRITLGPEVSFSQPSITSMYGLKEAVLLPTYPQPGLNMMIENPISAVQTFTNRPYLLGFDISLKKPREDVGPLNLNIIPESNLRPQIRPYYIKLSGAGLADSNFILLAEEYRGVGQSTGRARLHLYNSIGDPITLPDDIVDPSFNGTNNHLWSVATGNIDGISSNEWLPYYPNNKGNEIIVTQSTRDFVFPGSKVMVLRYKSGINIDKPSPPNTYLFPFDTICTQRINGWVAAVNDIDGDKDEKDEVFLVDGSIVRVIRLRDYNTDEFKNGAPFDTVFSMKFPQTISNIAIADLEGDGLNDIIVTTFDSTYIIGIPIMNTIKTIAPKETTTKELCIGDTVRISWMNYMKSSGGINIDFQPTISGVPQGKKINIANRITNSLDTNYFVYKTENKLIGLEGYFILSNSDNPNMITDSTSLIKINKPSFNITKTSLPPIFAEDEIFIEGTTFCTDSATIEISMDKLTWQKYLTDTLAINGNFSLKAKVPCPNFYKCDTLDADSVILARIITYKSNFKDTSGVYPFIIYPKKLIYTLDTNKTADPTKIFRWKKEDLNKNCDTLNILISLNYGQTYSLLESIPISKEEYSWQVPLNLPDSLKFRLCCNTCMRSDTTIGNYKPTYLQIVAPNPFRPPYEEAEIVYKVDAETNVTITIHDQADRLVAQPVKDQLRLPDFAYTDKWNGLRWDGSPCDSGIYYIVMQFSNGKREVYPIYVRK